MTKEFEAELRQKSPDELRALAAELHQVGWHSQAETAEAVLQEDKGEPIDPDSDAAQDDVAALKDKLELFRSKGWESNARRVAAELSRRGELDESDDDLTHAAELKGTTYRGP